MHDTAIIGAVAAMFGLIGLSTFMIEFSKRLFVYRERKLELMADRTAEKAAQYAAQVERLEQRMRVLERIATDKGVDVAQQIESLRDEPKLAALASEELN